MYTRFENETLKFLYKTVITMNKSVVSGRNTKIDQDDIICYLGFSSMDLSAYIHGYVSFVSGKNSEIDKDKIAKMQGGNLKLRQHYEGPLNKYTNVMKGWQHRWFVLNPDKGTLEYYVAESEMKVQNRPRGALHLAGAVISPSEEDSHTFVVNSASGDVYKVRAVDAKERQEWITRLRAVSELHSQALAQTNSPLVSRDHGSSSGRVLECNISVLDAFGQVQEWLERANHSCQELGQTVDRFPITGAGKKSTDQDLLVLKANSQATMGCLEECLYALQMQQRISMKSESSVSLPLPSQPPLHRTTSDHKISDEKQ